MERGRYYVETNSIWMKLIFIDVDIVYLVSKKKILDKDLYVVAS